MGGAIVNRDADIGGLALRLGELARERGVVVATAESCTGGLVAGAITAVAGSSAWFDCGFVTYSNAAKSALLGVPPEVIERSGAVSEATARAMAAGALARSDATLAVAVTGIAGPAGGTAEKPVGTVCLAWAARDGAVEATTLHLSGDREAVRHASVAAALDGLVGRLGRR
ncbi:MAG TPA: CinA family protein [Casimicrobiaceae bacterium]|nr:CinA family protein [Casimicrobiaceae bacterium]